MKVSGVVIFLAFSLAVSAFSDRHYSLLEFIEDEDDISFPDLEDLNHFYEILPSSLYTQIITLQGLDCNEVFTDNMEIQGELNGKSFRLPVPVSFYISLKVKCLAQVATKLKQLVQKQQYTEPDMKEFTFRSKLVNKETNNVITETKIVFNPKLG